MKDIAFGDGKSTTVCDFFLFLVTAIFGEGAGKQIAFSFLICQKHQRIFECPPLFIFCDMRDVVHRIP
jgi:hypothetical protein